MIQTLLIIIQNLLYDPNFAHYESNFSLYDPNFAHYDVLTLLQGYPSGTSTILRRDACHSTSVDVKVNIRVPTFDIIIGNTFNHAQCKM
jgi:hypothetical protein